MGLHTRKATTGWERLRGRGVANLAAGALAIGTIAVGCASGQSALVTEGNSNQSPDSGTNVAEPGSSSGGVSDSDGGYVAAWSDAGHVEPGSDASGVQPSSPDASVSVTCSPIVAGKSTLVVNGTTRTFEVQLPTNTSSSMALLFLWHGWNQEAATFASTIVYDVPSGNWVPFDPNAFPMPLMIVAPDDTGLFVVGAAGNVGLDWDIEPEKPPVDFPFFEAMLQCTKQQFTIDATRIYSFGFSAGAVFTDLLSAEYPHLFAATISESGAWFNDPPEQQLVLVNSVIPLVSWDWPAFSPADKGNVLLTHGGSNDFATIISLQNANEDALPFLNNNNRTVVECEHDFGHTLDPDLTQTMYYKYLWDHQLGGSPLSALPSGFPTQANPVGETSCYFHAAP
jgi:predicted esterase